MIYYFLFGTAFFTGLIGGLHCIGMCGPVVLALPIGHFSPNKKKLAVFIYHLGRITTYAIIGLFAGAIGNSIKFLGFQQVFTIVTGVFLLLFALPFEKFSLNVVMKPVFKIKQLFYSQFRAQRLSHLFQLGMLNGILPCGTVYLALAASLVVGNPLISSGYMVVFGFGTLPMLAFISFTFQLVPAKVKHQFSNLSPVFAILIGLFFILKGLNLNVPYLSPKISYEQTKATLECH